MRGKVKRNTNQANVADGHADYQQADIRLNVRQSGVTEYPDTEQNYEAWDGDTEESRKSIIRMLIIACGCLAVGILCAFIVSRTGVLDKLFDRNTETKSMAESGASSEEPEAEAYTANQEDAPIMMEEAEEAQPEGNAGDIVIEEDITAEEEEASEAEPEETEASSYIEDDDGIHDYEVIVKNAEWMEAFDDCKQRGGHLIRLNSDEEYDTVKKLLEDADFRGVVYLGAMRDSDSHDYHWVSADMTAFPSIINSSDYDRYCLEGEPSFEDVNEQYSVSEEYLAMIYVKKQGGWVWNDIPGNLFELNSDYYDGRVAYICEYE